MNDRDEAAREAILEAAATASMEHLNSLRDAHPAVFWTIVAEFIAQDAELDGDESCAACSGAPELVR